MRKEMEALLESTITRVVSDQLKSINIQFSAFQESMAYMNTQFEDYKKENNDLKKLLASLSSELKNVKDENKILKESLSGVSMRIKALEDEHLRQQQWVRLQNIEITGLPEDKGENTTDIVLKLIQHLKISVDSSDIDFAHRVQPRNTVSADRSRPIVVRLKQRALKDKIIAAARKHKHLYCNELGMRGGNNKVFINEHLTRENKLLLRSCKLKASEVNYKYIWTKNCRIFARKNDTSPPIPINSSSDLIKIV